jgi:acyl phosphate:glycerol-3-phosphate acyltransferase
VPLNEKDMWFAVMLDAQPWLLYAAAFAVGYASGSIPFGYIFARLGGAGDIRKVGSGNIGATNVLRTGRRVLALLTLLCDAGKGFLPVLFCRQFLGLEAALFAAAGVFTGHLFPVWLGFKGGKGVATYIGIITALFWLAAAFFCAVWLSVAFITRYSSLSALVAAALTPMFFAVLAPGLPALVVLVLSIVLIARHRGNISKLLSGREDKIRLSRSA